MENKYFCFNVRGSFWLQAAVLERMRQKPEVAAMRDLLIYVTKGLRHHHQTTC